MAATAAGSSVRGRRREQSVVERSRPEGDEDAWVCAALEGDERAFTALVDTHERRVLRVLRLLGVRPDDREDLAQETFIRAFRHLQGFHRGRSFSSWLYRIAVNVAHDYRRQQSRRLDQPGSEETRFDAMTGTEPEADASARAEEQRRRLEGALAQLSERERAVFVLAEIEELSSKEVAQALGITRITVRRHRGRARRHLEQLLERGD